MICSLCFSPALPLQTTPLALLYSLFIMLPPYHPTLPSGLILRLYFPKLLHLMFSLQQFPLVLHIMPTSKALISY
ncbi:hypothetical protein RchiOBHm_Chr3g0457321 [Rosa chinensis]|uniref:Uncharacterized protein n=1 Tax=Rosa chinensis TaxID=74649 RepID=A0A2P6R7L8_ROSCH|nr:hypothetical protein RchiOBHm_Chr3g0457321 [Rosa chinensis]